MQCMAGTRATSPRRRERLVLALLVIGALGALAGWTTYATLDASTTTEGGTITAGTVELGADATDAPLYTVEGDQPPDEPVERCVSVAYTGSLPSDVRLYGSEVDELGEHLDLAVTAGTGDEGDVACDGFSPDPGDDVFEGTLEDFSAAHGSWPDGLVLDGPDGEAWSTGDARVFRFRLTLRPGAGDLATGPHAYTWEARSR